jgi:hypothetical protein
MLELSLLEGSEAPQSLLGGKFRRRIKEDINPKRVPLIQFAGAGLSPLQDRPRRN